jgi:D-sedoheptulose 7-phosphate isomerase
MNLADVASDFISHSIQALIDQDVDSIIKLYNMLIPCLASRGKVLVFGNGGSSTDAAHFVGELLGRFEVERDGFPAWHLDTGSAVGSAISNDYGYPYVFSRQLSALANKNDLAIGMSTSGHSQNIINALIAAKTIGCKTVLLTSDRFDVHSCLFTPDLIIKSPSNNTAITQQCHMLVLHSICKLLDYENPSLRRHNSG